MKTLLAAALLLAFAAPALAGDRPAAACMKREAAHSRDYATKVCLAEKYAADLEREYKAEVAQTNNDLFGSIAPQ